MLKIKLKGREFAVTLLGIVAMLAGPLIIYFGLEPYIGHSASRLAAFFAFVVAAVISVGPDQGVETIEPKTAKVTSPFEHRGQHLIGKVSFAGETWSARLDDEIGQGPAIGQSIFVHGKDGLTLIVGTEENADRQ